MEIIALEYRQADFADAEQLAQRAARVADACAERGLEAVSMAGLLQGRPLGPGLIFGLRADDVEAAALFADAIAARGYAGLLTFRSAEVWQKSELSPADWVGIGLLPVRGGDEALLEASARRISERFTQSGSPWANIWMPATGGEPWRAVDGLVLEVARRKEVDLIWTPGSGVNDDETFVEAPLLLSALVDDGQMDVEALAAFCAGDLLERRRAQVMRFVDTSRRWLHEFGGGFRRAE